MKELVLTSPALQAAALVFAFAAPATIAALAAPRAVRTYPPLIEVCIALGGLAACLLITVFWMWESGS